MGEVKNDGIEPCISYLSSYGQKEWTEESYEEFWKIIYACREEAYANFNAKLIPEIKREQIIGIRIPNLRRIAAKINKGNRKSYLQIVKQKYDSKKELRYEEKLVRGYLIGLLKEINEVIDEVYNFLPCIDNWSVNDGFCSSLKITKKYEKEMFQIIQNLFQSKNAYECRFAFVMSLLYFNKEPYVLQLLEEANQNRNENYYVKMAIAWMISYCYLTYPQYVLEFLANNQLDDFTYSKSIQKIVESKIPKKEEKEYLKTLRRTMNK